MTKDDFKSNNDKKISNNSLGNEYFKELFSISIPDNEQERVELYFKFKSREREYKLGAQVLQGRNSLIYERMHIIEMFNFSFLFGEVKDYDLVEISRAKLHRFVANMCEIGILKRIEVSLYSKVMRKKHKGTEIIKYATQNCSKWRFDQLEAIEKKDQIYYLEEIKEREFQILKEQNKKRLTSEQASEKVVKTNSLIQKKSLIANIEFERKNKRKIKEKLNENQQTADQIKQKRIIDIKDGKICPSGATQKHLTKMKNQITKYTSGRHMGQEVNWLDRHYESCKVKFEDHPPE